MVTKQHIVITESRHYGLIGYESTLRKALPDAREY